MKQILLLFMLLPFINNAQTTFTATNAQISQTLTSGGLIDAHCIHASDTLIAGDDIIALQNVNVAGNINLNGSLIFDQANVAGFKYFAANTVNNPFPMIHFGKASNQTLPMAPICPLPSGLNSPWVTVNGGFMSHYSQGPINAGLKLYTAGWNGWGHIEVEGTNEVGADQNALAINYFCGRETHINTNNSLPNEGGWVRMGGRVSMQKHLEIGDAQYGIINSPNNEALKIHVNDGKGLVFKSYNGSVKLISIDNLFFPNSSLFTVYSDGRTYIGEKIPNSAAVHSNAKLSVDGKVICKSLYITIAQGIWADYVFEKNYKLPTLNDLEKYINEYKHLPNMPSSKEVEKNGVSIEETTVKLLEKLEEAYLYIINLEKRVAELEKK